MRKRSEAESWTVPISAKPGLGLTMTSHAPLLPLEAVMTNAHPVEYAIDGSPYSCFSGWRVLDYRYEKRRLK
ncbi:hypothetical protein [Desulfonatronum thiodismutans]|uniref:hypothetical protein n=1 Tax=Desulfonatronum thiodismutans TaxID=159290 RepID=UPI0012681F4C|nr:hypothetical protein [Desulfonatronum thiodismutans]